MTASLQIMNLLLMSEAPKNKTVESMKILFFMNILRTGAGMINREKSFAEELAGQNMQVSVLSYFKAQMKLTSSVAVDDVFSCRYRDILYSNILFKMLAFVKILFVLIKRRPQVVMVDLPAEARWAYLFRPVFGYKVIFTYHGVADDKFYKDQAAQKLVKLRQFGHQMLRKADRILVVSDFLRREMNEIGVECSTLYNGFSKTDFYSDTAVTKNCQRLLFVGRFTEYKGALNIVRAVARVKKCVPDVKLDMHGYFESPEYLKQIKTYIRRTGLGDNISLNGPLPAEELAAKMSSAGIFVNASLDETFCMPALEAQACGTPCVAFAAGGLPEVVAHGKSGLLASPGNVREFAAHICRLLQDRNFYDECCVNTKVHTRSFTYEKLTEKLMVILTQAQWGTK